MKLAETQAAREAARIARVATGLRGRARVRGDWEMVCRDRHGNVKWVERWSNIVVNQGLDELLGVTLGGGTQSTTWYLGLKGTGAPAAGDTMASHATWSEITPYSNANRPTWTPAAVSGQSITNSASKAVFNINATATVFGAFLSNNNTKSGTSGKLYAAGNFAASRDVVNLDTLEVTATFTQVDDGV